MTINEYKELLDFFGYRLSTNLLLNSIDIVQDIPSAPVVAPFGITPAHFGVEDNPSPEGSYVMRLSDYRILYEGCWCLFKGELVKVRDFQSNSPHDNPISSSIQVEVVFFKKGDVAYRKVKRYKLSRVEEDFNWVLPELGAINHGNACIFVKRLHKTPSPSRYRKGFREDTISLKDPTTKERKYLGLQYLEGVTFEILLSIFIKKYETYPEAMELLTSFKKIGVAISPDYYITLCHSINSFVIWRDSFIIGTYKKDGFLMNTDIFNKELTELGVDIRL